MILALFGRLLQSVKWDSVEEDNHDMDGLVEAVMAAYESFELMKLNCLFHTLQGILKEVINRQGGKKLCHSAYGESSTGKTRNTTTRATRSK